MLSLRARVLVLSVLASIVPPLRADCVRRIAADGPSERVVVLAGGNGWVLFQQYLAEAKQRKLDVDWWDVQAVIVHDGKEQTIKQGWMKMFSGESVERVWERSLKPLSAERREDLLTRADQSKWDVICIGPPKKPGDERQKPPIPPNQSTTPKPDATIYYKSGILFAAQRNYANALREFNYAYKLDPKYPGLLMNIGVAHMQLKDYVRAAQFLSRAIEQAPKDPAAHYNMACLQARLGQKNDAIQSLATAKALGMRLGREHRNDSDFASLRGIKRFENLIEAREQ